MKRGARDLGFSALIEIVSLSILISISLSSLLFLKRRKPWFLLWFDSVLCVCLVRVLEKVETGFKGDGSCGLKIGTRRGPTQKPEKLKLYVGESIFNGYPTDSGFFFFNFQRRFFRSGQRGAQSAVGSDLTKPPSSVILLS